MSLRRYRTWGWALLLLIVLVAWGCLRWTAIKVTVTNKTRDDMRDIVIFYRSDSVHHQELPVNGTMSGYVHPATETSLTLTYLDAARVRQWREIDCYLEPGYRGVIAITVTDQGVAVRDNVLPSLLALP